METSAALWRIELFDGLRVVQDERQITRFQTQKTGALLAYLAHFSGKSHPRETLIALMWPEAESSAGRHSLSMALSSLRHQLEPPGVTAGTVIQADRQTVQINAVAIATDVAEFEAALRSGAQAGTQTERQQWLGRALELYRGPLLAGYFEDWTTGEQQRLSERLFVAVQHLVKSLLDAGDTRRAVDILRLASEKEPLREEYHAMLMRGFVSLKQPQAALRQFEHLQGLLERELGDEPSPATRQLAKRIAQALEQQAERAPNAANPSLRESPDKPEAAEDSPLPNASAPASAETQSPKLSPSIAPPDAADTKQSRSADIKASPSPDLAAFHASGTVTFLMTDIEGSTALWERTRDAYKEALQAHHALLRAEFGQHHGVEIQEAGDGFIVAFTSVLEALQCAVACQRALAAQSWPEAVGTVRVRMALHAGDVEWQNGAFQGLTLHRASRLLSAAHGGQIVASEAVSTLLRRDLPAGIHLTDLGLYRLRDLPTPERIFQADYVGETRSQFPAPRAEAGHVGHLPLTLTRFLGREKEIALLMQMLTGVAPDDSSNPVGLASRNGSSPSDGSACRLLTLTGPGGGGKTRLSLEVGQRLLPHFNGAVWFAALADLTDASLIPGAILDAMRVARNGGVEPLTQLVQALQAHPSLLLLDNYEQLVEPGRNVVRELLRQVPHVTILVTSRQLLELSEEREFVIPPLPTPRGAQTPEQARLYESVLLFVDRAQAVRPDFQITPANAPAISALCDQLEGHPLALELAASRAQALSPAQMLKQLARRFDFLVSRKKDLAERHRSMRAALDWSFQLLSPELQQLLARLSVFRGGFSLEAVETVCGEELALDYLAELRECSLIVSREEGEEIRFAMLEMLRAYADEQLSDAERPRLRAQHAQFFFALVQEAEPHLVRPEQTEWLDRLSLEHDNIRMALQWSLEADEAAQDGLRTCALLDRFYTTRNHFAEGLDWQRRLLAHPCNAAPSDLRARALTTASALAYFQSRYDEARKLAEESLAISRQSHQSRVLVAALNQLGIISMDQGDYENARVRLEECAAIIRAQEIDRQLGPVLNNLGNALWGLGEMEKARAAHEEALAIRRKQGDLAGTASSLSNLGALTIELRDYAAACAYFDESLHILQTVKNGRTLAICLEGYAGIARAISCPQRAARLLGYTDSLRQSIGVPRPLDEQESYAKELNALREDMGEDQFQSAWNEGNAMNWEQAFGYALQKEEEEKGNCKTR